MGEFTKTKAEQSTELRDSKKRRYREYNGKRTTEIATDIALIRSKADGTMGKAAAVKFEQLDFEVVVIPINATAFRIVLLKISNEKVEP